MYNSCDSEMESSLTVSRRQLTYLTKAVTVVYANDDVSFYATFLLHLFIYLSTVSTN